MDDIKRTVRDVEDKVRETGRDLDGHDVGDDVGNAGDDLRREAGNLGDDIRRGEPHHRDVLGHDDDDLEDEATGTDLLGTR